MLEIPLGNIKDGTKTIGEMLDCDTVRTLRNIDAHIEGRCRECEHSSSKPGDLPCYGCRGQAFQVHGSITAADPDCRLFSPRREETGLNLHDRSGY